MLTYFSFFHVVSDELMSLSPYEMRNLLHHIMSGREFSIKKCQKYQSGYNIVSNNDRVSQVSLCIFFLLISYNVIDSIQHYFERIGFLDIKRPNLVYSHCYVTRLNVRKTVPFQFCLPVFLRIIGKKKQEFLHSSQGIFRNTPTVHCHPTPF